MPKCQSLLGGVVPDGRICFVVDGSPPTSLPRSRLQYPNESGVYEVLTSIFHDLGIFDRPAEHDPANLARIERLLVFLPYPLHELARRRVFGWHARLREHPFRVRLEIALDEGDGALNVPPVDVFRRRFLLVW